MSFFKLYHPKENIIGINFKCYSVLKNNYSEIDNVFCRRKVCVLSEYNYYDSEKNEVLYNNAIEGNNQNIILPYINIYVQTSDGNHFDTQFKTQFEYILYYMNFWGNKKIMEALINKSKIFLVHSDLYKLPVFVSDKILFSVL
jgi:hypothetical protein